MEVAVAGASKWLQSCLTLCDPIDSSPPGFTVPGIIQARTLKWVAISFSYFSHLKTLKQTCHSKARWKSPLCVSHFSYSTLESSHQVCTPITPQNYFAFSVSQMTSTITSCGHLISLSAAFNIVIYSSLLEILVSLGLYDPHLYDFSIFLVFDSQSCLWICPHFQDLRLGVSLGFVVPLTSIPTPSLISSSLMILDSCLCQWVSLLSAVWTLELSQELQIHVQLPIPLDCLIGSQTQHVQNGALDLSYPTTSNS